VINIPGPAVTLSSEPFPPLVVLGSADDTVVFSAVVIGGIPPYSYAWDRDGVSEQVTDNTTETVDTAPYIFTGTGKYQAQVSVIDGCGFVDTATLPVVVSDPGDMCHPTAQKISDGVNSLFPNQTGDLYTCEEIYEIFDGTPDDSQVGFGRMWKAYNLALSMEELTWEDIFAWHLDVGGWGALLQLDRFSELLETHSLPDLMGLVMSEDYSLGDVRTAVRSTTHYEADFDDALARIAEGANPGELGQLYKLAADLEVDPAALDVYLADGFTLSELKHTANFAERMEVDWIEIATARAYADSWGDLKKAYQMATDEVSAAEILIDGVHEYRKDLQEANQEAKVEQQSAQKEEKDQQTGKKLAEQYPAKFDDVMNLFNEECEGDWACVRNALREQESTQTEGLSEKGSQVALQIALKYGVSEAKVTEYFNNICGGDWACTRSHFREMYQSTKETGKLKK
ncbi:MAG: PKD domain-containing protein, partial [Anaerolineales bacterium]|nr:PKD domain-containing protein [Anaerolineales bacterium]